MNILSIPRMGESVSEAQIIKWLKAEGDTITRDEIYIEVSTDKVDSEIPSPFHCILKKILKREGETVRVGEPIAEIELKGIQQTENATEEIKSLPTSQIEISAQKSLPKTKRENNTNQKLSPLVRKMLSKNGIPISEVLNLLGSGNEGRITQEDVKSYINNRAHFIENQSDSIEYNTTIVKNSDPNKAKNLEAGDTFIQFDRMRGIIAKLMSESKAKSAHCTSFSEVDVTALVAWRDQIKDAFFAKHSTKITYTHLFMYLIIDSLKAFPKINAHNSDDGYILKSNINLGFATALPDGNLIVPNIKGIQDLSLQKIVEQVGIIGQNAKQSNLKPDDIQNGTFTMSNTGIFGSLMGTPIINQPQVAIMSLGEIIKTPAVVERDGQDIIEVRKKMILSLSYDHRIIDGAYAASFLTNYKKRIEDFKGFQF